MKIQQFNEQVLAKVFDILAEESRDPRCYSNIENILNNKLFGKGGTDRELIAKYMPDAIFRFELALDELIQKEHYPANAREKTIHAFKAIVELVMKDTYHDKPGALERVQQFKDTMEIAHKEFPEECEKTQRSTVCYESTPSEDASKHTIPVVTLPQVEVVNQDSFEAAQMLRNQGHDNVLVLNMANRYSAGGGVLQGASAQEEDLMRKSNYYCSLTHPSLSREMVIRGRERHQYFNPIPEFGSIYSPSVVVLKGKDGKRLKEPFRVSCIALAGYNLARPENFDADEREHLLNSEGQIDLEKFYHHTKKKIRHMLDVAIANHHDTLVLGALSCGAFKLAEDTTGVTAKTVAQAYRDVLLEEKYLHQFKKITFAVLDGKPNPSSNYPIFSEMLHHLQAPQASLLLQYPRVTTTEEVAPALLTDQHSLKAAL